MCVCVYVCADVYVHVCWWVCRESKLDKRFINPRNESGTALLGTGHLRL